MPATSTGQGDGHPPSNESLDRARLDTIESALVTIQHTLAIQFKRIAAMQAELDRLSTKIPR